MPLPVGEGREKSSALRSRDRATRSRPKRSAASSSRWERLPPDRAEDRMTRLWETDNYIEENTLTVNIARLRRKLDKAGLTDFISTKVGEGYIIRQERQVSE